MMSFLLAHWPTLLGFSLLTMLWAGATGHSAWMRHRSRQKRRAPAAWPLKTRAIINSDERRIWRWLELSFADYSVMVKMPVTRFSTPDSQQEGLNWYRLLSTLYCTFTVVRSDGKVMGCVDLPSRSGRPNQSQVIKASLLKHCGVPYLVLQHNLLPSTTQIRCKFLGDAAAEPKSAEHTAAIDAASTSLRNSISRSRQTRQPSASATNSADPQHASHGQPGYPSSINGFVTGWQDDSFIMRLDSRPAPLN